MSYRILIVLFLVSSVIFGQNQTKRALFLGNSYTYVNNLPQMIADIATSMGDDLIFDSNTPGGYTLQEHSTNTTSLSKINSGNWDYVILQEQSQIPAKPLDITERRFFRYAHFLDSVINNNNPCSETVFYMTWGRKNSDAQCTWTPACLYNGMDSLLNLRYRMVAERNNATLSPAGAVWHYIRDNFPAIDLYQADESHPSIAGSYAAACCFYTTLFKRDPTLIPFNSTLSPTDALNIKNAIKLIVYDSLLKWHIGEQHITPINYMASNLFSCLPPLVSSFTSYSIPSAFATYHWDFGDSSTSTLPNPVHTYNTIGNYSVKLVINGTGSCSTYKDSIEKTAYIKIGPIAPVADFSSYQTPSSIGTELNVQFSDLSQHNPLNWQWYFGDGNSSGIQNPTHVFADTGTYVVKLIVTNCNTKDSITKSIRVTSEYSMCKDQSSGFSNGTLYDSGGPDNNYLPNSSCTFLIAPPCAETVTLEFTQIKTLAQDFNVHSLAIYNGSSINFPVLAYIDNDDVAPIIITGSLGKLFIEFIADGYETDSGFVATWTSQQTTQKPETNFFTSENNYVFNYGDIISFIDSSSHGVSSWNWDFGDGDSSQLENPSHSYLFGGTYEVKLIAFNCIGSDTISKLITIKPPVIMCVDTNFVFTYSENNIKLLDSGGPDADYQNNENCEILFRNNNNTCANLLIVHIDSLNLDNAGDTLSIYDGSNPYAPLLFKGNQYLSDLNLYGHSGNVCITFKTNNLEVKPGFSLSVGSVYGNSPDSVQANYTYINEDSTDVSEYPIHFYDLSLTGIQNWLWNFGDGTTSNETNPIHIYKNKGDFEVTLIVNNCENLIDSITNNITVSPPKTSTSPINDWQLFPNPAASILTVGLNTSEDWNYKIFNSKGLLIQQGILNNISNQIDMITLSNGLYFLQLFNNSNSFGQKKFIKILN